MSQNDFVIANAVASTVRTDINSAFAAIASNSSGSSAPSTTYANQWWYDTSASILKIRNAADSAWLNVGLFSGGTFVPSPGFASQAEAEAGTENTKFMTALRVKQAAFPTTSIATNGYIELGGGLLQQWGRATVSTGAGSVTFPLAFPTAVFSITVTGVANTVPNSGIGLNTAYSVTGFSYDLDDGGGSPEYSELHWQAFGN